MTSYSTSSASPAYETADTTLIEDRVDTAARHMYEAETTLHCARQSHIDAWIAAAYDRLHEAVLEHATALAQQTDSDRSPLRS
jgi:hypothetical protein